MTLPEHVICSVMLAQFGVRQRFGWKGTLAVVAAGVAPDLDTAAKLVSDREFWRLHHALGHGLLPILILVTAIALVTRFCWLLRPIWYVWLWCFVSAAAHVFTDAVYWWGIQVLWPFSRWEVCFSWIEYLDLLVLGVWLAGAVALYRFPARGVQVALLTLSLFIGYLTVRSLLPAPTPGSVMHLVTGGWMYSAPRGTPVLDWW
jgi:membrane-bound metal-dependent hydrolase YbcI (DUF457 family)